MAEGAEPEAGGLERSKQPRPRERHGGRGGRRSREAGDPSKGDVGDGLGLGSLNGAAAGLTE